MLNQVVCDFGAGSSEHKFREDVVQEMLEGGYRRLFLGNISRLPLLPAETPISSKGSLAPLRCA